MKTSLLRWLPAAVAGCIALAAFAGCELPSMPDIVVEKIVEKDATAGDDSSPDNSPDNSIEPQPSADEKRETNTETSPFTDEGDPKLPPSESGPNGH